MLSSISKKLSFTSSVFMSHGYWEWQKWVVCCFCEDEICYLDIFYRDRYPYPVDGCRFVFLGLQWPWQSKTTLFFMAKTCHLLYLVKISCTKFYCSALETHRGILVSEPRKFGQMMSGFEAMSIDTFTADRSSAPRSARRVIKTSARRAAARVMHLARCGMI